VRRTWTIQISSIAELVPCNSYSAATSGEINGGVPKSLQGEDEGRHVLESKIDFGGTSVGIEAVGGGGDPGYHHGAEEEESHFGVRPGSIVGFLTGEAADGEDLVALDGGDEWV